MKNSTLLYLSIFFSIFIISCNTEAKFGFRKKIKADEQPTAKTIAKHRAAKVETKNIDTATEEIITSRIADEKIVLPKNKFQKNLITEGYLTKKVISKNTGPKKAKDEPLVEQKLCTTAVVGFVLSIIGGLGVVLFITSGFIIPFIIIGGIGFILSFIGLIQILSNYEEYEGLAYSIFGIILGSVCFYLDLVIFYFVR